jgi:sugar/nucleoside kinase (ribokinase family)
LPVAALPPEWRAARGWLLGPVAGELGPEWAGVAAPDARVTVGWQGLLRYFAPDGWVERVDPTPSPLLAAAGLVCASLDDLQGAGASLADLSRFAPAATMVLTAGERGGLVRAEGRLFRYPAIAAERVVDPTGAGDVFMAALTAAWLLGGEPATSRALRFAAAAGSCAVEGRGLAGVPTSVEIAARSERGRISTLSAEATPPGTPGMPPGATTPPPEIG